MNYNLYCWMWIKAWNIENYRKQNRNKIYKWNDWTQLTAEIMKRGPINNSLQIRRKSGFPIDLISYLITTLGERMERGFAD